MSYIYCKYACMYIETHIDVCIYAYMDIHVYNVFSSRLFSNFSGTDRPLFKVDNGLKTPYYHISASRASVSLLFPRLASLAHDMLDRVHGVSVHRAASRARAARL